MGPQTLPTAWFCPKCGLDHHNANMLTCRRPNCGGCNPTRPPLVPQPKPGTAAVISPIASSPSYSYVVQQPTSSSPASAFSSGIQAVTTPAMLKNITQMGFKLAGTADQEDVEMKADTEQQHTPSPPPPPAQEMQDNTQQMQILQETYQKLVQVGGPDSKAALEVKRAVDHHSTRITPVAYAKNSLSITQQIHAWEKSKATLFVQHQQSKEAKQKEIDMLKDILDAKEKELEQAEHQHSLDVKQADESLSYLAAQLKDLAAT
eukprot:6475149-Karenia_brevis.AAC.1